MCWSRLRFVIAAMVAMSIVIVLTAPSGAEADGEKPAEITRLFGTVIQADGSPAANVPLSVQGYNDETLADTKTDDDGGFEIEIEQNARSLANTAYYRAGNRRSQAITPVGVIKDGQYEVSEESRQIVLSPVREAVVLVHDARGAPVVDGRVILQLQSFQLRLRRQTDREGNARFLIAESNSVTRVLAWKDGDGFAHRSFVPPRGDASTQQADPPKFSREGETLKLEGARSLSVRVVDANDQPISGQTVYPWLLNPPDELQSINLSFFFDVRTTTDEAGVATFAWIPTWQRERITFWNSGTDEYTHRRILINPDTEANAEGVHGTIKVEKRVRLSGRVVDADGQPASDVAVSIAGNHGERHFADVTTDEEGTYETLVPPNMAYLITAKRLRGHQSVAVADTMTGFAVLPETPYKARDLILRQPSIVSGTLKDEAGSPMPDQTITFYHYGIAGSKLPFTLRARLPRSRSSSAPILFYYAKTDEQGQFELGLGDGSYDVRTPGQRSALKFEIDGDATRHFDLTFVPENRPSDLFTGTVAFPDGRPASGALIEAFGSGAGNRWKTKADAQGRFSVNERGGDKTLQASAADGTHAASVPVNQDASKQRIVVQPVGSVELTLTDHNGEVMANRQVRLSATLHQTGRSGRLSRDVGTKTTNDKGRVRFQNLVAGRMHRLSFADGPDEFRRRILTSFKIEPGEDYEANVEVKLSLLPTPTPKTPTSKERLERWLSVDGTPAGRFEKALRKLAVYDQKLLIVIGKAESSELEQWIEIKYGDADYRRAAADYATMVLAIDRDADGVGALIQQLKIAPGTVDGLTLLMVDRQGSLLERAGPSELMSVGKLSSSSVVDFIRRHPITLPTGRERLDAALAQAKREGKRVFVQETATWCGPCHKLTDLLLANTVWEKDFVYVMMDHRLDGAFEIMKELRDGGPGGIPWFAILDSDGKKLVTSNKPRDDQNIGFPSSPSGREHFGRMFKETSERITEADVDSLLAALEQQAD
jgi:protocatechuate 3,4-dioxygenase beta subunit